MNSDSTEGAGMIEALAWLEVNKKRVAIGAAILLVLGFGIYVWSYFMHQKEVEASVALLDLRPEGPSTNQIPVPAAAFSKVAQEHQGTSAAERATLLAAGALFTEGKYPDAQKAFDDFLRTYPSSPWAFEAAYGVATSLEAQGKRDEALTAYQRVTTTYSTEPVVDDAHKALARIYEAKGQFDLALKQYDELARPSATAQMGMNMGAQESFLQRERLLRAHPELKPAPSTNAPAMTSSSTNAPMTITAQTSATVHVTAPKGSTPAATTSPANNAAAPKSK